MNGLFLIGRVWATWSILAVDPETSQVGIAGATCGPMVWGIAGIAPGHGVVFFFSRRGSRGFGGGGGLTPLLQKWCA